MSIVHVTDLGSWGSGTVGDELVNPNPAPFLSFYFVSNHLSNSTARNEPNPFINELLRSPELNLQVKMVNPNPCLTGWFQLELAGHSGNSRVRLVGSNIKDRLNPLTN